MKIKIRITFGNTNNIAVIGNNTYDHNTGNYVRLNRETATMYHDIIIDDSNIPEGFMIESITQEKDKA
jgi:hypothetical protein